MQESYDSLSAFMTEISSFKSPKKPKIALLGSIYADFDGVGKVIDLQAKELSKDFDISIFTLEKHISPPNGVNLYLMGAPKKFWQNRIYRLILPLNLPLIWKYLRELKNFDIVIAHLYPLTVLAYLAKHFYGVKYVYWHYHTPMEFPAFYSRVYMELIKYFDEKSFIIKNADYICSISGFSRELLKKRGNIDSIVIYPHVEERFKKDIDDKKIRKRFNLKDSPLILFVGRISPQKNIHMLIEAFERIKKSVPHAKLMIVGKIVFDDYFEEINGINDESIMFTGYVPDEELPYYYAACDVYASCSISEGFNLPLVEAQMCGKPVVAFDIDAHTEVVRNGYLVKKENINDFVSKIIEIIRRV